MAEETRRSNFFGTAGTAVECPHDCRPNDCQPSDRRPSDGPTDPFFRLHTQRDLGRPSYNPMPDEIILEEQTAMRVAFLGMGIMGRSMAENLVKAGHEVAVWNRTA